MNILVNPDPHNPLHSWGLWAVVAGAVSLILVLLHIGLPMSQPSPSVGSQIGEIAGDASRAAWRSFFGLEPEVEAVEPLPFPIIMYLGYLGAGLGVVAVVLAMVSGIKRENWHYSVYGTGLGASAVLFYFFWWLAALICGVLLLIAIIENMGSFFSFGLWD
ncbi:MAG: hypothetical protein ACU0GG_13320 [Paracoccaceae bacterium]